MAIYRGSTVEAMSSILNRVKRVIFKDLPNAVIPMKPETASAAMTAEASKYLTPAGKWRTVQFKVDQDWSDVRLDRVLTKKFDITASLAQKLIRLNKVWIERGDNSAAVGKRIGARAGLRVLTGDSINLSEVFLPERKAHVPLSEAEEKDLSSWTIFENESVLVLNKPSGLAVHTGPGIKVSVDELLQRRSAEHRLVHRLDRGTSGVLIVGKTRAMTEALQNEFASTSVKKTYLALVAGTPKERSGQIKTMIYKAKQSFGPGTGLEPQMTTERTKRADLMDEGSVAITDYKMISAHMTEISGVRVKLSLMEFTPQTGRTHQIRVHSAENLGCPIVGDSRYGLTTIFNLNKIPGIGQGLHLHCKSIQFPPHITDIPATAFEAPLSKHFVKTLNKFPIRIKPPRPGHPNHK